MRLGAASRNISMPNTDTQDLIVKLKIAAAVALNSRHEWIIW